MEFVPVDASAEDGLAHGFVIVVVVVGAGLGVLAVVFEDELGVGMCFGDISFCRLGYRPKLFGY